MRQVDGCDLYVSEIDDRGRNRISRLVGSQLHTNLVGNERIEATQHVLEFLGRVFLPSGYPGSVSPDYLRYQILNALQAFCNSLASLISSRAVLEGMGVGNASATATQAMLLTVLQDVFSRLMTICGAYYLGSSLYPEAKLYRFLADVLNDIAVILDTLSPLLMMAPIPGLRVGALCLSSSLRALCGLAAGGSKAAITLHFASPVGGKGDVGDLNAKDASKETVLALTGMLLGTLIVPYLKTPWSIYPVLFLLVAGHLGINYLGVRGLALRTLNRQRAALSWLHYRQTRKALSPAQLAPQEHILDKPSILRDPRTHEVLGECILGSSPTVFLRQSPSDGDLSLQADEKYFLWFRDNDVKRLGRSLELHICLKEGHTPRTHLKAWAHASTVALLWSQNTIEGASGNATKGMKSPPEQDIAATIGIAHNEVQSPTFTDFLQDMQSVGWDIKESVLMAGAPKTLLKEIRGGVDAKQKAF